MSKEEVVALEKFKKKSLVETRKKAKLDKSLEKKEAFELDEVLLASVLTLSTEEHKRKLEEDASLVYLAGKVSEEIPEDVVMEFRRPYFLR